MDEPLVDDQFLRKRFLATLVGLFPLGRDCGAKMGQPFLGNGAPYEEGRATEPCPFLVCALHGQEVVLAHLGEGKVGLPFVLGCLFATGGSLAHACNVVAFDTVKEFDVALIILGSRGCIAEAKILSKRHRCDLVKTKMGKEALDFVGRNTRAHVDVAHGAFECINLRYKGRHA